ncbi:MAG: hypothetical protein ACPG4N_05880 [Gammaproteobacteria bacterium]
MHLIVTYEGQRFQVDVDPRQIEAAKPMFEQMDKDMDQGIQMGRYFVQNPDEKQKAQMVAHKLMLALSAEKESTALAMAAYILDKDPNVAEVDIDTTGEMQDTRFIADAQAPV